MNKKMDSDDKTMRLAVDLDGTLAHHMDPFDSKCIGSPMPGAMDAMKACMAAGHSVIIHTCRVNSDKQAPAMIKAWLKDNGFPDMPVWSQQGKPDASLYLDNKGMHVCPEDDPKAWSKVCKQLMM